MIDGESVLARHEALCDHLNERDRRLHAASEAKVAGWGGIVAVSRATGIARSTIGRGLKDLASPEQLAPGRVRREGGGRKPLTEIDPTLLSDLEGWWSRIAAAIRCRRFAGLARACAIWSRNWAGSDTRSAV